MKFPLSAVQPSAEDPPLELLSAHTTNVSLELLSMPLATLVLALSVLLTLSAAKMPGTMFVSLK